MTKAQKKIVLGVFLAYSLIILSIISTDWILMHWNKLMWPLFIIILIMLFFEKDKIYLTPEERSQRINKIAKQNTWVVLYYMVFLIFSLVALFFAILKNIRLDSLIGRGGVAGIMFLIFFPIMAYNIKEMYLKAGKTEDD